MLLPYMKEPATGSLIPSISTGGAAMKATMKHAAAVQAWDHEYTEPTNI